MTLRKSLIGELLVADALISPSQLEAALEQQQKLRERLCAILVSQGLLDWKTIHHWLAKCRGFACIDPAHYQINRELLKLVPGDFVRGHDVFPLDRFGNQLTVGMAVPLDTETIRELSEITGLRVKPVLCSMDEVRTAIARYYPACEETGPSVTVASGGPEDAGGTASLGKCAGELVRKIERLPALPDSVRRIGELLEQPDIEVNEAAAVIRRDAAITAKLLSVANSAAFSFKHQVKTVELAVARSKKYGTNLQGSVTASDAFFPFADGAEAVLAAGATAIVQPGGSVRDAEVIAACDRRGAAMVFTGERHFRH